MKNLIIVFAAILLTACVSTTKNVGNSSDQKDSYVCGNTSVGASMEDALQFPEITKDFEMTHAEYAWVKSHMPNCRPKSQALLNKNGRIYDMLTLVSDSGKERELYFDITNTYGKF